jgi:hypothetical protein
VLYGYWSHDIGGHLGDSIDPEMYTRWLQYGGFSPVMRTHSSKSGGLNKEPWVFTEEYTNVIRQTVRQRYVMAPYIYTMARKGYDEALALCRPMYYDYPECQEAYDFRSQYMFGDDMLIAPVVKPATDGFAEVDVWLPEGEWFELHTGTMIKGGAVVKRHFALDEYGVYVKAGSVLPFYGNEVNNLDGNDEDITLTVFPEGNGSFSMYEDAGNDKNYAEEFATTAVSNVWSGNVQTVTIAPRQGQYAGMPAERQFKVKVVASVAPEAVAVNGVPTDYSYDGTDFSFTVDVPVTDCAQQKEIVITYPSEDTSLACGVTGYSRRMGRSIEALKFRTGIDPYDALGKMGTVNEAAMYAPESAAELVAEFMKDYERLEEVLKAQPRMKEEDVQWFLGHCGRNL